MPCLQGSNPQPSFRVVWAADTSPNQERLKSPNKCAGAANNTFRDFHRPKVTRYVVLYDFQLIRIAPRVSQIGGVSH
ncbi:unnamed protein product [Ixodes pacificus]